MSSFRGDLGHSHVPPEIEATPEVEAGLHLHSAEGGLGRPLRLLQFLGVETAVGDGNAERRLSCVVLILWSPDSNHLVT